MQYGNCLTGALLLMLRERRKNPQFIVRVRIGTKVPHFMVRTNDSKIHHYKVVKDIFCWPFCYFLFRGEYETVNILESENYRKHYKR